MGDGIHLDDDNEPIRNVVRVLWCYNETSRLWHAEVTLS